jgi:hypothetical protein
VVVGGEDGGGRTDGVPQSHSELGRRRGPPCEVHSVHIGERVQGGVDRIAVDGQVVHEFSPRVLFGDLEGTFHVAEEGHARLHRAEVRYEAGDSDGQASSLAVADCGDLATVDSGQLAHRVDGPYRVSDEATVVVGGRIEDPAREEAGRCGG